MFQDHLLLHVFLEEHSVVLWWYKKKEEIVHLEILYIYMYDILNYYGRIFLYLNVTAGILQQ